MRETYAIKITKGAQAPGYLTGYASREEAERALAERQREPGSNYSVVYVKEYLNRAQDEEGNYTRSTIAEIKEPGL